MHLLTHQQQLDIKSQISLFYIQSVYQQSHKYRIICPELTGQSHYRTEGRGSLPGRLHL